MATRSMVRLTVERLRELLSYDPRTGVFTWKVNKSSRVGVGRRAGCADVRRGYVEIYIDGRSHRAHRLAWLYVHGNLPTRMMVDHKDGDGGNNRIDNLRLATRSQNAINTKTMTSGVSGYRGVFRNQYLKRPWAAKIKVAQKEMYLGAFYTPEEASAAYENKRRELFGEFVPKRV